MPKKINVSIVIPVYNRDWCIQRAIESAVSFLGPDSTSEIVLVDDGSSDSSLKVMNELVERLASETNISFKLSQHEKNRGVCAAKNSGARNASGDWLIFFDSDDELIPGGLELLQNSLPKVPDCKIHFYTAIGENTDFIPTAVDEIQRRDFRTYLALGSGGEALPIIERNLFLNFPYDEDIRGYESLAYMRMVKQTGYLTVHSLGLRRYYTAHGDRLSSRAGMKRRWGDLAKGHSRVIAEHGSVMTLPVLFKQCARFLKAKMLAVAP